MARATTIEWPNREKASSKLMRAVVILALLVSSALMLVVSIAGWELLQSARIGQILFVILNVIFMIQLLRWSRGVLPMAAGLAVLIGIFAAVSIPSWYARDAAGYSHADLSATLGFVTILIVIVQVVVVVVAIMAFLQNWQIEVERPVDDARDEAPRRRRRSTPGGSVAA